jgi:hypothetical protein
MYEMPVPRVPVAMNPTYDRAGFVPDGWQSNVAVAHGAVTYAVPTLLDEQTYVGVAAAHTPEYAGVARWGVDTRTEVPTVLDEENYVAVAAAHTPGYAAVVPRGVDTRTAGVFHVGTTKMPVDDDGYLVVATDGSSES